MEITIEEYQELKKQVSSLQSQLDKVIGVKHKIASMVNVLPISHITAYDHDRYFTYRYFRSDAWAILRELGKEITKNQPIYMERKDGYFIDITMGEKHRKYINELSELEKEIVAQMLTEMVNVYNRYFKILHPTVLVNYKNMPSNSYIQVPVKDIRK